MSATVPYYVNKEATTILSLEAGAIFSFSMGIKKLLISTKNSHSSFQGEAKLAAACFVVRGKNAAS